MLLSFLLFTLFFLPPNITEAFNIKPRKKIPISPPPITLNKEKQTKPIEVNEKRTEHSKTFKNPDGTFSLFYYPRKIHKRDGKGGWVDIDTVDSKNDKDLKLLSNGNPTPLSLCLYANGSSFANSQTEHEGEMWLENYNESNPPPPPPPPICVNYSNLCGNSETYILYPDLKDLIPQTGSLTEVKIVTEFIDPEPDTFTVEAYAITQAWNPHTLDETNIPPTELNPSATAIWNLAEGTEREQRSIDITTLALDWFSGTKGSYGVKLKIQDPPSQSPNGIQGAPLPVLLTKYQVQGSPSDPEFGGSYYSDSLTPPQLIPGRALFVHRVGEIGNIVKSWTIAKYHISEGLPFCTDIIGGIWRGEDEIPLPTPPIDVNPPVPCSVNYFNTYSFPALNDDIYPNNALNILPPSEDPNPPGLNPSPPGPFSYQFLNLSSDPAIRHDFIDGTRFINTPVSRVKYLDYPSLNIFTVTFQDDDSRFLNNITQPLSSLPYLQVDYAFDMGNDGENENQLDKAYMVRNIGDITAQVNPKNGNLTVGGGDLSITGGLAGCANICVAPTYNVKDGISLGPFGKGWRSVLTENANYSPDTNSLTYYNTSGSTFRFNPVYDENNNFNGGFYSPPTFDWNANIDFSAEPNKRIKLTSKTGDMTYYFNSNDGYLREVTTAQGGEIIFNRNPEKPELINSIEDGYSGRKLQFTYDPYDRIIAVEDPLGRMVNYEYNEQNELIVFTDAIGRRISYEYDELNRMKNIKLNGELSLSMDYQVIGDPMAISSLTDRCGNSTTLNIDPENKSSTITDRRGYQTEITYYDEGSIESMKDALGNEKVYYPDSEHASTQSSEVLTCASEVANSNKTEIVYDPNRNPIRIIDPEGNTITYEYTDNNKPATVTDREGNEINYIYSPDGALLTVVAYPNGKTIEYNYDSNKFVTSVETSFKLGENVTTTYTHDANGYIDKIISPLGIQTDYDYDILGRLAKVTDPLGNETAYTYDDADRLTKITADTANGTKDVQINYDQFNNVTSIEDPAGNMMNYSYDECGNLQIIEDPLNNATTLEHDAEGNLISVTDARGNTSSATYDPLGRTSGITDPLNNTTSLQYDDLGRLYRITDPKSNITELSFDDLNRLTQIKDPQNNIFSFTYNKEGYLKSLTDPKGADYYLNYNSIYQVINLRNPKGTETNYEYYPFGGIKKATNPLDQYVTYDYDEDFRPIKVTDHQNRFTEYTYDNADRVTQVKDHTNRITKFKYDGFGNLTETEDPLGNKTKFEYDISNNLTATITPMNERYEYYYDTLDRVIKTVDPLGEVPPKNWTKY